MSPMVAFEPGRTTRSASPGRARPGSTNCTSTPGSATSGSRSSKFAIRESTGTATLIAAPGRGCALRPTATESSAGSRLAGSNQGTTPKQGRPVLRPMISTPESNRRTSPRNRLTT